MLKRILVLIGISLITTLTLAQPQRQLVTVAVAPDRPDWTYEVGEDATFSVLVSKYGAPLLDVEISYELRPDKLEPLISGTVPSSQQPVPLPAVTLRTPGFIRCWATVTVDGREYQGVATAGFSPEKIEPTIPYPKDFVEFWDQAKKELAELPLDARMTLLPDRCTAKVNVYHVSVQNHQENSRIYGILCVPKAAGRYPAILRVPGAGVRSYRGDLGPAEEGIITFQIGIHGIPVTMDQQVYNDMRFGALEDYPRNKLDDRDKYYYKRVYLGCVRSVDFIFSLSQFDGRNIGVIGGSQGGALSIVTAGLDPRIKWLASFYPALSDVTGYLYDRAGGWPHLFRTEAEKANKLRIATVPYYDVVNFARQIRVPGMYSWGFNDVVCPPTSTYSAYNVISAPKNLLVVQDTGHWTYPEQRSQVEEWLKKKLKGVVLSR
jgi:cephalosporin-C deacetylase-like acetyl esterase